MRDLPHLASLVFNRPLLIRSDIGQQIIEAIGPRILRGETIERAEITGEFERPAREARVGGARRFSGGGYMDRDGIAVLPIVGSLVRRGTWLDAECGMMSYGLITSAVTEILMDPGVRGLMLEVDSGGGEANGCFDCADFIRTASEATGKPVWAHANELMCSAAFAIGSSAERIWVARTAEVGSIGVLGAHVDRSGADEIAGVKWTYIFAGDHKTDGNPHESLGEGPRARMQADVDNLMDMFVELASQNRGMTEEEIRATNADIYRGRLAVESGLADEVGTLDEALEAFAAHVDEMQTDEDEVRLSASQTRAKLMGVDRGNTKSKVKAEVPEEDEDKKSKASETEDDDKKAETTDEDDAKAKAKAEEEEEEAKKASASVSAVKAESDRCAGLVALAEQASRLGVTFNAQAAIKKGLSVDAARKTVMDAASEDDEGEVSALAAPKSRAEKGGGKKVMSAEDKRSAWAKGLKRR